MSLNQLEKEVKSGDIETVCIVTPDQFGRFMGKRLDAEFFLETQESGSHFCNYLFTVDIDMEPQHGFEFANWESGYGDFHVVPDLNTLRRLTWQDKTALVIGDVMDGEEYVSVAPRSLLHNQVAKAASKGYAALSAAEMEYYIYGESFREAYEMGYHNLKPEGYYIEDYHMLQGSRNEYFNADARRHLKNSGVPVELTKGEAGVGQHELNIKYSNPITNADYAALYKQCLKELAEQKQMSVTFMAKPNSETSGSSCHIHMSLVDIATGANVFCGDKPLLGDRTCSDEFRWFVGGCIKYMPETMVFYAPTVNSYKRYISGSWAPTKLAWSLDNRTAGFRVVGSGAGLRVENRIPGADCNAYLGFSAALASGLKGIEDKIEPPELFQGDVYSAQGLPQVPSSLLEAADLFKKSEFAREAFGDDVVDHYARHAEMEVANFNKAVTDWERRRYFE
eukprot:CAMPEP_0119125440 /NCGR_PEP_ID=MMETSP1310-20130426/4715_1 /TAXON_ID=464262 /ORGANISM="Genus nov. species nov., Strain RCC2339" /LENGTH=450 /DNA_ID=CAMNT_0007115509 /DNA_START=178 /DNA_END=1527 /DNA_ORIENTATION=+